MKLSRLFNMRRVLLVIGSQFSKKDIDDISEGFVLIEILLALLVLSVAAVSFLSITRDTISVTDRADKQFEIFQFANQLIENEKQKSRPDLREEQGESLDGNLNWTVLVQDMELSQRADVEQPRLIEIKVSVSSKKNGWVKPLSFKTILTYPNHF